MLIPYSVADHAGSIQPGASVEPVHPVRLCSRPFEDGLAQRHPVPVDDKSERINRSALYLPVPLILEPVHLPVAVQCQMQLLMQVLLYGDHNSVELLLIHTE